jgi:dihydrofolate reductase
MIYLIWAMDQNRLIGSNQSLPWHIKDDLTFFKSIVNQKRVLMGMQTYLSMKTYFKNKPFPYVEVYVATRQKISLHDAIVIDDVENFLNKQSEDLYILGGSKIYEIALNYANVLFITYVLQSYEGDTYFPNYDLSKYSCVWFETKPGIILSKYERKPL